MDSILYHMPVDLEIASCSFGLPAGCKATGPVLAMFAIAMLIVGDSPPVV